MPTATITADTLDLEAARLYDTATWRAIVEGWQHTAPEPTRLPTATEATEATDAATSPDPEAWRALLSVPVDQLITRAETAIPAAIPPAERPLPGRLGAILPDLLHAWRRIGQPDVKPSVQLGYARLILTEWGWQNQIYKLRDARGARCLCGAILTAQRLGYGTQKTSQHSAALVLTQLRHAEGWGGLIGPWNRTPGRTATQALAVIDATIHRAQQAGY